MIFGQSFYTRGTFGMHGFEPVLQNLYHIEPLNPDSTEVSNKCGFLAQAELGKKDTDIKSVGI